MWPRKVTCPSEPQLLHEDQVLLLERLSGRMLVTASCARHSVGGPAIVAGPLLFLSQSVLRRKC